MKKEVNFIEAVKAFGNNKTIACETELTVKIFKNIKEMKEKHIKNNKIKSSKWFVLG